MTGKTIIVIPARMGGERLPGKPMLRAGGKPLVRWTYERAKRTKADHVMVATPDEEISDYCVRYQMNYVMTRPDHPTGTARCLEAVSKMRKDVRMDVLVNWQVDEPLAEPHDVDRLIDLAKFSPCIATLVAPFCDQNIPPERDDWYDSNVIKAAVADNGRAFWFSRAPLRGAKLHCGIYAFSVRILGLVEAAKPTELSRAESLEQLAWLQAGLIVRTLATERLLPGVNTPEDWEAFKLTMEEKSDEKDD